MTSNIKPSGHTFAVFHNMGGGVRRPVKLELLGGYAIDRTTIVIFRDPAAEGGQPADGLLELRPNGVVRLVTSRRSAIDLHAGDFDRFDQLPDHYQFLLGSRWWRKLPVAQLGKRLHRRQWRTA